MPAHNQTSITTIPTPYPRNSSSSPSHPALLCITQYHAGCTIVTTAPSSPHNPRPHYEDWSRQHPHSLLDPQFRSLAQRLALSLQPSAHQLPLLPILLLAKLEICLEKGRPAKDGSGERRAALAFAWNIAPTDAKVAVTSTRSPQAHGQHTSPVPGKGEDILAGSTRWRTLFPDEVRAHPR